jgi:hypothetical protein
MGIQVDYRLSATSTNPIANSVVKRALDRKADSILLNNKADSSTVTNHTMNNDIHVTAEEKKKWNSLNKVNVDNTLSESNNPVASKVIKSELNKKAEKDVTEKHIKDNNIHITNKERQQWNHLIKKVSLLSSPFSENFSELENRIEAYDFVVVNAETEDHEIMTSLTLVGYSYDKKVSLSILDKYMMFAFYKNENKDILTICNNDENLVITGVYGYQFNQIEE